MDQQSTASRPSPYETTALNDRDNLASLQSSGYEVLGISPDAPEKLAGFAGGFALTFPLLSDQDHSVALAYGAWGEKIVNGEVVDGLVRSTVVLDGDGKVVRPVPDLGPGPCRSAQGGARHLSRHTTLSHL